ncbi:MAG: CrcB family protein, partial [Anaerobutyricum sp.]
LGTIFCSETSLWRFYKYLLTFMLHHVYTNFLVTIAIALVAMLASKGSISNPKFILFLKTGICGGFTTFSTFALESTTLIKEGHPKVAFLYMVLSLLAGVCTIFATELVLE